VILTQPWALISGDGGRGPPEKYGAEGTLTWMSCQSICLLHGIVVCYNWLFIRVWQNQ